MSIAPGPHPDDRVELPAGADLTDPRFANTDLAPVPVTARRWTTYNFLALCVAQEGTRTSR
jgi:NCS1 family nucleobase:cation symporter-1